MQMFLKFTTNPLIQWIWIIIFVFAVLWTVTYSCLSMSRKLSIVENRHFSSVSNRAESTICSNCEIL